MSTTTKLRYAATLAGLAALAAPPSGAVQEVGRPVWIGIGYTVEAEPAGVRVVSLPYGSPAEDAGVILDDLIVGVDGDRFEDFAGLDSSFRSLIARRSAGDRIALSVVRGEAVGPIQITVELGERPAGPGGIREFSSFDDVELAFPHVEGPGQRLAERIIEARGIGEAYGDLRRRLARLGARGDRFRLSRVAYIQNEPFQLQTVAEGTFGELGAAMARRDVEAPVRSAARWLDIIPAAALPPLETGLDLSGHLQQLTMLLSLAAESREAAFGGLTGDDRRYLEANLPSLFATFAGQIDLQADLDRERWRRNVRVLELVARVDFRQLFQGAALLSRVADGEYLDDLRSAVREAWEREGEPEGIFVDRQTPVGRIVVGGHGDTWYAEDAAILIDLDGRDFYTNNAGSSRGDDAPSGLLVDFGGDDAYEASFDWAQGAATMGYAVLIDRQGSDAYLGQDWAQGAAALGVALFVDEGGGDTYRARQYAQGVAAWGAALHVDYAGDDSYDAGQFAQGVALAGGAGWLMNLAGDDRYYAKGVRPTEYGDPGVFDSWSQGSAVGFRGLQSGGVALLYDASGRDRYEAGNFSQGGGYSFGAGFLRDDGGDDVYVGSRYNQGFAAHQSIGYFEDAGGNDFYTARPAVAQGIAWDEAIVVFIDRAGDDVYAGGLSFSQGASAHNGFCLFFDLGGRDRFGYRGTQGAAGPNDYHGGASFSMFVAADSRDNHYDWDANPPTIRFAGEYGIFADLPVSIDVALETGMWRELIGGD